MVVTFILGTRPEVIKLAPVAKEAARKGWRVRIVQTGQYRHLTEPLLRFFGLPDVASELIDLDAIVDTPSLSTLCAKVLARLDERLGTLMETDALVIHGDTSAAFIGAYWAFCRQIPIAHIEAGSRPSDLLSPFPEDSNRILMSRLADIHFATTPHAMRRLLNEGVLPERVYLSGNTAIDSLLMTLARIDEDQIPIEDQLPSSISRFCADNPTIVMTTQRLENVGLPLTKVCTAVRRLADSSSRLRIVCPVDPEPSLRSQIAFELSHHPRILLTEPLPYVPFVQLMARADVLLTDSGGIEEEAPTLRKPILVMRETTERMESVEAGLSTLVGTDPDRIVETAQLALAGGLRSYQANPYGDGRAASRIVASLNLIAAERRDCVKNIACVDREVNRNSLLTFSSIRNLW